MRLSTTFVLAVPVLALAQQQIPFAANFQPWIDKAQPYIDKARSYISNFNPVQAGAAKVAQKNVEQLTLNNWKTVLTPSPYAASIGPEEWMVLITGGNKTCDGRCDRIDTAFNETVALLSAEPSGPKFAMIDCDNNQILCHSWAAGTPSLYHILLPQPLPDQSKPATTIHIFYFNRTTVTASDITRIHTEETWREKEAYEGAYHPFDGWLAKTGLSVPLAYVTMFFATTPSWLIMIVISFMSRTVMSRRLPQERTGGNPPAGGTPAAQR